MSDLSQATKKSDVIVIGAGPLGWACAQLLSKEKIRTTVIAPECGAGAAHWASQGLGVFWPSLNDPPTRAVVAHGLEMAQWLQDFCSQGIAVAESLLGNQHMHRLPTYRIALENHERVELKTACQLELGLTSSALSVDEIYTEKVDAGVMINSNTPFKTQSKSSHLPAWIAAQVMRIEDSKDVCRVHLDNGTVCESEMIILANGFHIGDLQPWLAHMLVPMSDVLSIWRTSIPAEQSAPPVPFRAASGHVAGLFQPEQISTGQWVWRLKLSGPRFLLPQAGAGVDLSAHGVDAALPKKIEAWVRKQLLPHCAPLLAPDMNSEYLTACANAQLEMQHIGLGVDCLPCDELPMLGDLGHHGRILGATGWLGCGWSAGFQAAALITEIIKTGKAKNLRALLRPSRWRSGLNESVGGVTGMT